MWREHDGPPVAAPTQPGFGTRLIERSLAAQLGASVKMNYEPTGLVCTIDAPLSAFARGSDLTLDLAGH